MIRTTSTRDEKNNLVFPREISPPTLHTILHVEQTNIHKSNYENNTILNTLQDQFQQ